MSKNFKAARDFLLTHARDYRTAYAEVAWPELDEFNWAMDWFDSIAGGPRGQELALWVLNEDGSEKRLSFRQLSERSSQIANYFRGLGVKRGNRMMLMLGNIPALWETILAAMKLGAVITPTSTLLTSNELRERVQRGAVRHIVSDAEFTGRFGTWAHDCNRISAGGAVRGWHDYAEADRASRNFEADGPTLATDPLQLYFTSGTTSRPKLVLHSHRSYPVGHLSTMYWIGLRPGDIHCNVSAPGWAKHAWSCVFAPWNAEAAVFVFNQSRFNARNLLDALVRARVTTFCAPPTVWRMLVLEDLPSFKVNFRELLSAGEPLNPEIIIQVRDAWGITIREGYGQTETTAVVGYSPGDPVKPGFMGRSLPGYRVALIDPEGKEGNEGQICIRLEPRPTGVMVGYQKEDGQIEPIQGPFHKTGDLAALDADGYLTFIGRADDVFKTSDYRVSPFELESVLIEHPDVVECAIVPSPDPVRLAVPKAYIVLRPGITPCREAALSIFRHVRQVLAPYKRVRTIEFSELPKTISGKIRRVELREAEQVRVASGKKPLLEFREEEFPELTATPSTKEAQ